MSLCVSVSVCLCVCLVSLCVSVSVCLSCVKGAIRELKKDTHFLSREKLKESRERYTHTHTHTHGVYFNVYDNIVILF